MAETSYDVTVIGTVGSELTDTAEAPKQGDEGAPNAWLVFEPEVLEAVDGIEVGDRIVVLTWLHRADRSVLRVHPRDDPTRAERGVFSTRSSSRPNPIGLHTVEVIARDGHRLQVGPLEAIDGTPIVDIKCVLDGSTAKR